MARSSTKTPAGLPVIDMSPLDDGGARRAREQAALAIEAACRKSGFFYLTGHGVPAAALQGLEQASRGFFALPEEVKLEIAMAKGGPAWRGFFPVGQELTSGRPDVKEGIYFGSELPADHPRVKAGWPLHGANLWPAAPPELRPAVEAFMAAAGRAAQRLLTGIALSLDLEPGYFAAHYTADPTILFRIFHYPSSPPGSERAEAPWGVGEHSDYGLLTLLAQDESGGLQVKTPEGWIDAPPLPGTLVCNIGDMLDRLTGGWYRSTPHRVLNDASLDRLSFPFFFDPDFAAEMKPLPSVARGGKGAEDGPPAPLRWDGANLQAFEGSYGDYLLEKVSKVFPQLGNRVL